jgi:hypothetical protein
MWSPLARPFPVTWLCVFVLYLPGDSLTMPTIVFNDNVPESPGKNVLLWVQVMPPEGVDTVLDPATGQPIDFEPKHRWFESWGAAADGFERLMANLKNLAGLRVAHLYVPRGCELLYPEQVAPGVVRTVVLSETKDVVGYVEDDTNRQRTTVYQSGRTLRRLPIAQSGGLREGLLVLYSWVQPGLFDVNIEAAKGSDVPEKS